MTQLTAHLHKSTDVCGASGSEFDSQLVVGVLFGHDFQLTHDCVAHIGIVIIYYSTNDIFKHEAVQPSAATGVMFHQYNTDTDPISSL